MRHANISIFVPHLGCPNDCSFCNQRHITGVNSEPSKEDIDAAVLTAVSSQHFDAENTEIAFFGGSFTAIDRDYMLQLLNTAKEHVITYGLKGIRISTRPDFIDSSVLDILKEHLVTAIELGAQSLDDEVLKLNNRGHLSNDVINASALIKEYGFELGLQMMTGLYGDSDEKAIETAEKIVSLKPQTVRIYPTILLKNTCLERLYNEGKYTPQTVDEAVNLCAKLLLIFKEADIKVIRTGLHSIEQESFVAGPWHPAFSELCASKIFLDKITAECKSGHSYEILIHPSDISKVYGQKRQNIEKIMALSIDVKFIQTNDLDRDTILIREVK